MGVSISRDACSCSNLKKQTAVMDRKGWVQLFLRFPRMQHRDHTHDLSARATLVRRANLESKTEEAMLKWGVGRTAGVSLSLVCESDVDRQTGRRLPGCSYSAPGCSYSAAGAYIQASVRGMPAGTARTLTWDSQHVTFDYPQMHSCCAVTMRGIAVVLCRARNATGFKP